MSLKAFIKTVGASMTKVMVPRNFEKYGRGFRRQFDGGFFLVSYNVKNTGRGLVYSGSMGVRLNAVEKYLETHIYSDLVETKHNVTVGGTLPQLTGDSSYRRMTPVGDDYSKCGDLICADLSENWHLFDTWKSVERLDYLLNNGDLRGNVNGFFVPINRIAVGLITAKINNNPAYPSLEREYLEITGQIASGFYVDRFKALARGLEVDGE